ncbi:MAG TPA: AraC family transcriptional regulator [Xanthobacteraceae bacterium]
MSEEYRILKFSSEDIPQRDRLEYMREVYGRAIIKHDIEPFADHPLRCGGELRTVPGLGLAAMASSAVRTLRTPAQVESDDLVFSISLAGGRTLRQLGREVSAGPGEALLSTSAAAGICDIHPDSRWLSIRMPFSALAPTLADLDAALRRPIPAGMPALSLLVSYLAAVQETNVLAQVEARHLVVTHIHDLVALTIGAPRDVAAAAAGRGLQSARLGAVKADIAANLGMRELSLATVAQRQGISTGYVRKLFERDGTSFSDYVLDQRLTQAHRLLTDPRWRDRRISAIVFEVGFGDLSYFNRSFRRRYGASPSELREQAFGSP